MDVQRFLIGLGLVILAAAHRWTRHWRPAFFLRRPRHQRKRVTSGLNFTQNRRFEFS
jgi:hypothetical protein